MMMMTLLFTHINGDVDAEIAVVCKQLGDVCIKDETVGAVNGSLNTVMNTSRRRLPRQAAAMTI